MRPKLILWDWNGCLLDDCEYVYKRYGRFPAASGPFRTVLAHQAHRIDPTFYAHFYRPEALSPTQRQSENGQTDGRTGR